MAERDPSLSPGNNLDTTYVDPGLIGLTKTFFEGVISVNPCLAEYRLSGESSLASEQGVEQAYIEIARSAALSLVTCYRVGM